MFVKCLKLLGRLPLALLVSCSLCSGQTVLVNATFNDTDDGLLEPFSPLNNGIESPAWNQATGEASMSADEDSQVCHLVWHG